jgi:hypothetical protein
MPRTKKLVLASHPPDEHIIKLKSFSISELKAKRKKFESELASNVEKMVKEAQRLYEEQKLDKSRLNSMGFLSVDEAYEEVKKAGIPISLRAFGGRIERRSLRSEKIGNRRLIARPILHDWISTHSNFYSIKKAYEILKQHDSDLNLRAFIGRIEKNAIPSIKINTQRWIPKEVVDSLVVLSKNYFDVAQAVNFLHQNNINIKRNAFERRLDRGAIPFVKIGGKRYISKAVMNELLKKELEYKQKKQALNLKRPPLNPTSGPSTPDFISPPSMNQKSSQNQNK